MPDVPHLGLSRRNFLKRAALAPLSGWAAFRGLQGGALQAFESAETGDSGDATRVRNEDAGDRGTPDKASPVPENNPSAAYPVVDAHVHVWTRDPRFPWARETRNPPNRDATAEQLLALMKASGVSRTVIIQVIHYRWDNRYAAAVLKRYPQFFRGVARVNPEDPEAPDHLSRLTEEDGFRGVRISPSGDATGDWIRGPLMEPLWRRCRDLKVPMTILAPVTRMPDVMRLAGRFPDLTIVVDHMADCPLNRPGELEKLLALRRFPRVYVKISHSWSLSSGPYPYLDSQRQIRRIYDAFGPRRLIAGTDWPLVESYCTYGEAVEIARSKIEWLTADDRRWICGLNAGRVWPFGAG